MFRFSVLSMVLVSFAAVAQDGERTIRLATGAHALEYDPVSVRLDGQRLDGYPVVRDGRKALPTTAYDGRLYFVPAKAKANSQKEFRLTTTDAEPEPGVVVREADQSSALDILIDGTPFTTYYFGADHRKPHMWPVNGEGGVSLTRMWPMGEADQSKDHPHHQSLWTAYGDINGADWWEYGGRTGWQSTEDIVWGSGSAAGFIRSRIIWQDKDRQPVLAENREYIFYAGSADARIMDVNIVLTAEFGDAHFGDTKEGGMVSVRIADVIRERGGTGTITNSAGGVGAGQCWGKPAAWCDYSGEFPDGGTRGLTIMNHPSSFRFPTHWHVRDYGLMGANAFGYSYFTDGEQNGEYDLKEGDTMRFRYRVFIHSGDVEDADVARHYGVYAEPPVLSWRD